MTGDELNAFVDQVRADAERIFGRTADPALLDRYARAAVLELWLEHPGVTIDVAEMGLRRLREEFANRTRAGLGTGTGNHPRDTEHAA